MKKSDIYKLLADRNISRDIIEHRAVYTIEGVLALNLPDVERVAKNLFLQDDKKNYYLLTVRENRKINLKDVQARINSRRLSFAKEERLIEILGVISGAVTPFGVLNDTEKRVSVYFDRDYDGKEIGVHPLDNTATVFMQTDDLMGIISPHCKTLQLVNFD